MLSVLREWDFLRRFFSFLEENRFSIHDRDPRYYADGEDAFSMRRELATTAKTS